MSVNANQLLSAPRAARLAGVSRRVFARWCRLGMVPGARRMAGRWYVHRERLVTWLGSGTDVGDGGDGPAT